MTLAALACACGRLSTGQAALVPLGDGVDEPVDDVDVVDDPVDSDLADFDPESEADVDSFLSDELESDLPRESVR